MMLSVIFGGKYCNSLGNCILCSALFLRFFLSLSHSIFLPLFFLHSHSRFSSLVYLLYCAINMASNALTSAFITLTYTQHTSCLFFILNERKKNTLNIQNRILLVLFFSPSLPRSFVTELQIAYLYMTLICWAFITSIHNNFCVS